MPSQPIPLASLDYKKFGAVGDGVTDDTAAVQAAIDDFIRRQTLDKLADQELEI